MCCVCVDVEMVVSESAGNGNRDGTSTNSWSRGNGWSWPPHPFQIFAWVVLLYISVFFYVTTVPALVVGVQIACYVVSLLLVRIL